MSHELFADLDEAVVAMRERALAIRSEGPLRPVRSLRDFEPGDRVHARLQLSTGGLLKKTAAGVDVRGDGTLVPFRGGVVREEMDPSRHDTPFDLVRETLEADAR